MNIPPSVPITFDTGLGYAVETALGETGLDLTDPAMCRYTVLTEGLLTDGTRFALSLTDGDTDTSRETRADLLALFTAVRS